MLKPNFELVHTKQTALTTKELKKTRTGRAIGLLLELLHLIYACNLTLIDRLTHTFEQRNFSVE